MFPTSLFSGFPGSPDDYTNTDIGSSPPRSPPPSLASPASLPLSPTPSSPILTPSNSSFSDLDLDTCEGYEPRTPDYGDIELNTPPSSPPPSPPGPKPTESPPIEDVDEITPAPAPVPRVTGNRPPRAPIRSIPPPTAVLSAGERIRQRSSAAEDARRRVLPIAEGASHHLFRVSNDKARRARNKSLRNRLPPRCTVCNRTFSSAGQLSEHNRGQKHAKELARQNPPGGCLICKIPNFSSWAHHSQHFKGERHRKSEARRYNYRH